jgi:hypothetical protein
MALEDQDLKNIEKALTGDREKLGAAIAKAFSKIQTTTSFEQAKKELKALIKAQKLNRQELTHANVVLEKQSKIYKDLLDSAGSLQHAFAGMGTSLGLTQRQNNIFAKQMSEGVKSAGKFGGALYQGTGDIKNYTSAFENFGGIFGHVLADVGERFSTNLEAFRQLSNVGGAFNQSLVELRQTAASAGLPLGDFVDLVAKNSESLAALYGSTSQGARAFSELSEQFRSTSIETLAPLGLTVDDLNETLLTSLNLQRRSGQFGQMSDAMQIKSATALALEMDKLTKLTGQNRSQLTKQLESQLTNERFLASLGDMTEEARNRMSSFAASVGTLAPGLAEGFQDLIANAGIPVTESARTLVQNIPEATAIIQQLQSGSLSASQAMVALRDAAKRSNESLRGVAKTGTVEFARLYGAVNQLASAKMDEVAVTEEQRKRNDKLTNQLTQFEDAAKRVSAGFQSIETGFFATVGGIFGQTGSGINATLKGVSSTLQGLSAPVQAMLFMGKTIGSYFLDTTKQIGVTSLGVAAGIKMAGGMSGMTGPLGKMKAGIGRTALKGGGLLAGAGLLMGGMYGAGTAESGAGKAGGVLASTAGGAMMGSMIAPGLGTVLGGIAGFIAGMASLAEQTDKKTGSRARGTMGMLGLPAEPRTTTLQIERGERVLNPTETRAYNQNNNTADMSRMTASFESKIDLMVAAVNKTNSIQEQAVKALNTQVALTAAGNKISDKTRKGVASMGSLV